MTAYYYMESGKLKKINLHPSEYAQETRKRILYNSEEEAKKGEKE